MDEIVRNSVQSYCNRLEKLPVRESVRIPGFFVWEGKYDADLLGYMAEIIGEPSKKSKKKLVD
jgi:hypothetical protein